MVSRREFLRVSSLLAATSIVSSCVPTSTSSLSTVEPSGTPAPSQSPEAAGTRAGTPETAPGYREAPTLASLVQQGQLPPVEARLPLEPHLATGLDGIGNYGGALRKSFSGQSDSATVKYMLDRGLVACNEQLVMRPMVAASWQINEDATQHTFGLRKGMRWSDGQPLTTEDYRFYYEDVILNREITSAHPEALASVIDGERVPATFEAVDEDTIRYTFEQPKALFHYWSGVNRDIPASPAHYMRQFHRQYVEEAELKELVKQEDLEDWTQLYIDKDQWLNNVERPVHYPWVPRDPWTAENVIYQRNPYFWETDTEGNQLPYLDQLQFGLALSTEVAVMRAVNGEIDCQARTIGSFDNFTVLKEGEATGDYTVQVWRAAPVWGFHFNMTTKDKRLRELFSARDFRIATSLAMNRDEMRELLFEGYGTNRQYSPPQDSPLYHEALSNAYLDYDPEQANLLLDSLGYKDRDPEGYRLWDDGSNQPLSFTLLGGVLFHGGGQSATRFELLIMDYLKGIGLKVNYRGLDRALSSELHAVNEVEMTTSPMDRNLVPLADPRIFVGMAADRPFVNAWRAWRVDPTDPIAEEPPSGHWIRTIWDLWDEIQRTADEQTQNRLFSNILDIWAQELPCIGLFGDLPQLVVVKNGLKGIHSGLPYDSGVSRYEYLIDDATWYWDNPDRHTL